MAQWDKDRISLMLYFETCLVDQCGRVEGIRMNKEDYDIAKKFSDAGLIEFGRIEFEEMKRLKKICGKAYTNYVKFSEPAWALAHKFRKDRAERNYFRKENK